MVIRPPGFWYGSQGRLVPALLWPLARIISAATGRRVGRAGWRAPIPVVCCGNVNVGGTGKTTLAIDLGQRLRSRGLRIHFLLRGFGGSFRGTRQVTLADSAASVGDEALLLAQVAPTWIGADRARSAEHAIATGADILVLDDGLQNPTLAKDLSFLVVDGGAGFGNGRVLPAGPLRESIYSGAKRCQAAVLIGDDITGALAALPIGFPVLRARLVAGPSAGILAGRRVMAFAGIARPEKFFTTVRDTRAVLVEQIPLTDHQFFTRRLFERLRDRAQRLDALLVTTAKDAARLSPEQRDEVHVVHVYMAWDDEAALESLLDQVTARRNTSMNRSTSVSSL